MIKIYFTNLLLYEMNLESPEGISAKDNFEFTIFKNAWISFKRNNIFDVC